MKYVMSLDVWEIRKEPSLFLKSKSLCNLHFQIIPGLYNLAIIEVLFTKIWKLTNNNLLIIRGLSWSYVLIYII